jgi:DNA primase
MKEWEAGQWNTPERRAAFEHRIRQLISEIQDPLVRSHYQADLQKRLQEKWKGAGAPSKRWSQLKGNTRTLHAGHIYPGKGTGAFPGSTDPASESLKNSNLVRGQQGRLPSREAVLMLTVLNHPWLIEEFSEEIAGIEFESRALSQLRKVILELQILQNSLDREGLNTQLRQMGQDHILDRLARAITHRSDGFALPEASEEAVRAGWSHILTLHRKMLDLKRELANAERAYEQEMTEENLVRLIEVRNQISDKEGTEASMEGHGLNQSKTIRAAL